jgi:photosystem II stability/assembly factor-like uncharacterized protein
MAERLYVASRKGLLIYRRAANGWRHASTAFLGSPVSMVLVSADNQTIFAALSLGHFGTKLHRSSDGGTTWTELQPPQFPKVEGGEKDDKAPAVSGIWSMEWAGKDKPGALWIGTAPAALFYSNDNGATWARNEALWDLPTRAKWMGGGTVDTALHSICVDPRDSNRVAVAVSCGGVTLTEDGGRSWRVAGRGLRAEFMPPEQQFDPDIQDAHLMVQCPADPRTAWIQHHNGIFRSTDDLKSWHEITTAPVSSFGFAVAVHPKDPDTAWFAPAVKDEFRYPADGKMVVQRTRDGGKTFDVQRKGLPQENAFDLIYRHGLVVDETGNRLAMGSTTGALWTSDNGGEEWTLVSAHLPPIHALRLA